MPATTFDPFHTQILTNGGMSAASEVIVVAIDARGAVIMLRHDHDDHAVWTYPHARRPHRRVPLHATARRLLANLGYTHHDLHLVDLLAVEGHTAALFIAHVTPAGQATSDGGCVQAMAMTRDVLCALDLRPREITELLTHAATPADSVNALIVLRARDAGRLPVPSR